MVGYSMSFLAKSPYTSFQICYKAKGRYRRIAFNFGCLEDIRRMRRALDNVIRE